MLKISENGDLFHYKLDKQNQENTKIIQTLFKNEQKNPKKNNPFYLINCD